MTPSYQGHSIETRTVLNLSSPFKHHDFISVIKKRPLIQNITVTPKSTVKTDIITGFRDEMEVEGCLWTFGRLHVFADGI
jgi:hypothetical protein